MTVEAGRRIGIMDTILRDAHQSLMATRMRTEDMLPIAEKLDKVGYFSLEVWGGATFDVCLRYLKEDPWERLRELRRRIKNTRLQMLLRGQNLVGYRHYADDVVVRFIEKSHENGIDIFRIFDALNDVRNMEMAIRAAKRVGAIVEGTISYTISPVHTVEQFVRLGEKLAELGSDIICIKDMAGILAPKDAYDLVAALKEKVGLPVHLHCHCTSGMAPMAYMAAAEAGVDILDTAISALAWGTSQPPTESIVAAFKGTPMDTGLDLSLLSEIGEYFREIRKNYQAVLDPITERVDANIVLHQIPGGMISNLISQLKERNALDKYNEVLKETERVREDLGYPPLVTPTSQMVGTQAVFNVVLGQRYKMISKEVRDYVRGLYGTPPAPINPEIVKKVIGNEKPIMCRPADLIEPELEKAAREVKEYVEKEEDILSYAMFPQVALEFFKVRKEGKLEAARERVKRDLAGSKRIEVVQEAADGEYTVRLDKKNFDVRLTMGSASEKMVPMTVSIDGRKYEVEVEYKSGRPVKVNAKPSKSVSPPPPVAKAITPKTPSRTPNKGDVTVPMPGKIVDVKVKKGDKVKRGDILVILEAMKMQNEITAPFDGTVEELNVVAGDNVDTADVLVRITPLNQI